MTDDKRRDNRDTLSSDPGDQRQARQYGSHSLVVCELSDKVTLDLALKSLEFWLKVRSLDGGHLWERTNSTRHGHQELSTDQTQLES